MFEVIRAAELPVNRCLNMPWADFCKLVHGCWAQSTCLVNWGVQQLAKGDVVRTPKMKSLPKMPKVYLYGLAKKKYHAWAWWAGAYAQANGVLREGEQRYRALRKQIVWDRSAVLPTFRYPHPFPVHNQCWSARYEHGRPVVRVQLPGGMVDLELRGGAEFGRQLALFRSLVDGKAKQCALAIRGHLTSSSNGRQTMEEREPGGSDRKHWRILVKLVVKTEATQRTADRVLTLCTDPAALWVAELDGRRAWALNADHIRRVCEWKAAHDVLLQRWGEDTKAERRGDPDRRRQFNESRERRCQKHARRMDSWIKESVAHLLRFCLRQKVGEVLYLDRDRGFADSFEWYKLNKRLVDEMTRNGIVLNTETDLCPARIPEPDGDEGGNGIIDLRSTTPEEDDKWQRITRLREMAARRTAANLSRNGSHPAVSVP